VPAETRECGHPCFAIERTRLCPSLPHGAPSTPCSNAECSTKQRLELLETIALVRCSFLSFVLFQMCSYSDNATPSCTSDGCESPWSRPSGRYYGHQRRVNGTRANVLQACSTTEVATASGCCPSAHVDALGIRFDFPRQPSIRMHMRIVACSKQAIQLRRCLL
jgi:hypothetical protein